MVLATFQLLGAPSERIWPSLPDLPNVRSGKIDVLGVPHRCACCGSGKCLVFVLLCDGRAVGVNSGKRWFWWCPVGSPPTLCFGVVGESRKKLFPRVMLDK